MKVIIIGGGVAGLATGWRLLQAGAAVTLLERGQPGKGATWAAAGMIARLAELEDAGTAELAFSNYANGLWPSFAAEIEQVTSRAIGFQTGGALMLAHDAAGLAVMQARAAADSALAILSRAEVEARLPMLTGEYSGALWSADEAQVDNRALADALTIAFLKAGGELLPSEPVVRIGYHGDLALSVSTPYGHYGADAFLLAAGAWSGLIGRHSRSRR